jgi:hypothetical protein
MQHARVNETLIKIYFDVFQGLYFADFLNVQGERITDDFNRLDFISVLNQRNRWMDTTYQRKINRQTINNLCKKKHENSSSEK